MAHEFSCKKGCTDCCTLVDSVPVTFGDLARAWLYGNSAGKSFYQVFEEHCSGWNVINSPGLVAFYLDDLFERQAWDYWPVPKSKNPCAYIDSENKLCKSHGKLKYSACLTIPEISLVPQVVEMGIPPHLLQLCAELPCLEDAFLGQEKINEVVKANKWFANEIIATGKVLGCSGWVGRQEAQLKFNPEELDKKLFEISRRLDETAEKRKLSTNLSKEPVYDYFVNLADRNVSFMF